jgi:hypothetical protein
VLCGVCVCVAAVTAAAVRSAVTWQSGECCCRTGRQRSVLLDTQLWPHHLLSTHAVEGEGCCVRGQTGDTAAAGYRSLPCALPPRD